MKAKKEWADTYNAIRRNDDEPWCFLSEYRRSLERQMEPLSRALLRANMVFDSIQSAIVLRGPTSEGNEKGGDE